MQVSKRILFFKSKKKMDIYYFVVTQIAYTK